MDTQRLAQLLREGTDELADNTSAPGRFAYGFAEPMIGLGQLVAHGVSAVSPKDSYLSHLGDSVDEYWKENHHKHSDAMSRDDISSDIAGGLGEFLSPSNLAVSSPAMLRRGPLANALGGAIMKMGYPVYDNDNYGLKKWDQAQEGAVLGLGISSGLKALGRTHQKYTGQ